MFLSLSGETEWLAKLEELQLSSDEGKSFETLKLKKAKPHKSGFIAQTDHLKDRTAAEVHKGKLVYIRSELLQSQPGENIFLAEIEGFEVIDQEAGRLGTIEGFATNTAQDLILIHDDSGELVAEVPLVEAFIERIDFEGKKLLMKLPPGLLEVGEE